MACGLTRSAFGLMGGAGRPSWAGQQTATSFGTPAALVFVQLARGLTALSAGQHATAFGQLQRLFDPADPAYHSIESGWILGDLAEAARHSGHLDEARAELDKAEPLTTRTPAPLLHVAVRQARALLAAQDEAENSFKLACKRT